MRNAKWTWPLRRSGISWAPAPLRQRPQRAETHGAAAALVAHNHCSLSLSLARYARSLYVHSYSLPSETHSYDALCADAAARATAAWHSCLCRFQSCRWHSLLHTGQPSQGTSLVMVAAR